MERRQIAGLAVEDLNLLLGDFVNEGTDYGIGASKYKGCVHDEQLPYRFRKQRAGAINYGFGEASHRRTRHERRQRDVGEVEYVNMLVPASPARLRVTALNCSDCFHDFAAKDDCLVRLDGMLDHRGDVA